MIEARRRFGVLAVATAAMVAAYPLTAASLGVHAVAVGQALAATLATASCAYAAVKATGRTRTAWALLTASSAIWAVASLVSTRLPYGGYVMSASFSIAALLTFRMAPAGVINRVRALLDGLILAVSLSFVVASLGAAPSARLPLGYPVADLMLLTIVVLSARRSSGAPRITLAFFGAGYVLQLVADAGGLFPHITRVGGLLLVGLAAWWPADLSDATANDGPGELWQLTIPWFGILALISSASWAAYRGVRFDADSTSTVLVVGVLFVLSQVLAIDESRRWLRRTRTAESNLRGRTELLGQIIEHAPLGIARVSRDLRYLDSNPHLAKMLGIAPEELVGAPLSQFTGLDDLAAARRRLELLSLGKVDYVELDTAMRTADRREIWVHRVVTPVFGSGGRLDYFVVMFEDETAKHASEKAAMANLAGLERLSHLKSEFMSMVSHEFRTALTGIQGYSEVMKVDDVSPEEVREFAGDINADALRLNRLITDMLDMDRIESGRMQLHIADTDINQLTIEAADRARMSTAKHTIRVETDPRIISIQADADRLTQVVSNLLSNAIKYSPDGGDILVATNRQDGDVVVGVSDHGIGIPPEFRSRIFGRYERFEDPSSNKVMGTGLGLALSQQIVEMHKGRIWVESEVGHGSTFKFAIPMTLVRASAATAIDLDSTVEAAGTSELSGFKEG